MILKFRKQARDILGIDKDEEEEKRRKSKIEVEPLTEEQKIDQELQDLINKQNKRLND